MTWRTKVFLCCRLYLKKIQERKIRASKKTTSTSRTKLSLEKLKIRILELYFDGVEVAIEDPVNESWLGFLNVLQMNARSLLNFDRRMKFGNAITVSDYTVVCICVTWLNENIESAEMLLHNYTLFRSDKKLQKNMKTHGDVMVAIKNSINCELLKIDQPECSLTCKLEISNQIIYICVFHNPPKRSRYRYVKEDFEKLIAAVPKTKAALICGDLNFPNTNWSNFGSEDEEEQSILKLFENALYQQGVEFYTRGTNTLDIASFRNCSLLQATTRCLRKLRLLRRHSYKAFTGVSKLRREADHRKFQYLW